MATNETGEDHSEICETAQHFEVKGDPRYDEIITRNFRKWIHEHFCEKKSCATFYAVNNRKRDVPL